MLFFACKLEWILSIASCLLLCSMTAANGQYSRAEAAHVSEGFKAFGESIIERVINVPSVIFCNLRCLTHDKCGATNFQMPNLGELGTCELLLPHDVDAVRLVQHAKTVYTRLLKLQSHVKRLEIKKWSTLCEGKVPITTGSGEIIHPSTNEAINNSPRTRTDGNIYSLRPTPNSSKMSQVSPTPQLDTCFAFTGTCQTISHTPSMNTIPRETGDSTPFASVHQTIAGTLDSIFQETMKSAPLEGTVSNSREPTSVWLQGTAYAVTVASMSLNYNGTERSIQGGITITPKMSSQLTSARNSASISSSASRNFAFSTTSRTWNDAQNDCQGQGGNLAMTDNANILQSLYNTNPFSSDISITFHIGLSKAFLGTAKWIDGSSVAANYLSQIIFSGSCFLDKCCGISSVNGNKFVASLTATCGQEKLFICELPSQ